MVVDDSKRIREDLCDNLRRFFPEMLVVGFAGPWDALRFLDAPPASDSHSDDSKKNHSIAIADLFILGYWDCKAVRRELAAARERQPAETGTCQDIVKSVIHSLNHFWGPMSERGVKIIAYSYVRTYLHRRWDTNECEKAIHEVMTIANKSAAILDSDFVDKGYSPRESRGPQNASNVAFEHDVQKLVNKITEIKSKPIR